MIQVLTTQRKMRVYLHDWEQVLALYCFTLVTVINKFNVALSFRNLKKVDIVLFLQ